MKILVDYHHTSLLRSLIMLFEDRLDIQVYRPIGLDWYECGFWAVHPARDTAEQYLSLDQAYRPTDGTPPLNQLAGDLDGGVHYCHDPGTPERPTRACTLEYVRSQRWDYVLASMPQHIAPFRALAKEVGATLLVQAGNEWPIQQWYGANLLASIASRPLPSDINAVFYHQEFDINTFRYDYQIYERPAVSAFMNCLPQSGGWHDFLELEHALPGISWKSFGGQCRDGCVDGVDALASEMRAANMIFHVKPGGDGYGHILHNAYAVGRSVITRRSHYFGKWGEILLTNETCIDIDMFSNVEQAACEIEYTLLHEDLLDEMSNAAYSRFREVVNFDVEEMEIRKWLERCR